jgi:pimeloyl-ACP methyl ester carboxylesterase
LGFAEYGARPGKALFYFHGHPGSRLEAQFLSAAAERQRIRLIGIDRPGMGLSTHKPNRRIIDWSHDVVALADALAVKRFAIVSLSGGSPYALACALRMPNRLTSCGMVSPSAPVGRVLSFLSSWLPWLLLPIARRRYFRDEAAARKTLSRVSRKWPAPDRRALDARPVRDILSTSLVEGLRQGSRGAAYDGMLLGHDWGFELSAVTFAPLHLWHGELDRESNAARVRELVTMLPQCKATFYPAEGHISLIANHADEIISVLTRQDA